MEVLIDWIVATPLSGLVLDHGWLWPAAETLHFIGLVMLAGCVGLFDLRVLGVARGISPAAIHRLVPLGVAGFGLSLATGLVFIAGTPDQYFYNAAFHWKLVLLAAMGANVAFFYARPFRAVRALGPDARAPAGARISAAFSLAILIGVMYCGRMLTFFRPPF